MKLTSISAHKYLKNVRTFFNSENIFILLKNLGGFISTFKQIWWAGTASPLNNGNLNFKYWWWWGQAKYKLCLLGGTELAEIISAQWDKNSILIIVCYKKLLKQLLKLFTCLPFLRSSCLVNIQTSASTGYGMELAEKACRGWLPFFVTLILWRTNIFQSKAQKYFWYNLYEALWAGPANERNVKWSHHINIINLDTSRDHLLINRILLLIAGCMQTQWRWNVNNLSKSQTCLEHSQHLGLGSPWQVCWWTI